MNITQASSLFYVHYYHFSILILKDLKVKTFVWAPNTWVPVLCLMDTLALPYIL